MNISTFFLNLLTNGGSLDILKVIPLVLILGDFLTGIIAALRTGTFDPKKLMDILSVNNDLVKFFVAQFMLFFTAILAHWGLSIQTIVATLTALGFSITILTSVVSNVNEWLPAGIRPLAQELETDVADAVDEVTHGQVPGLPTVKMPVTPTAQSQPQLSSSQFASPWQLPPLPQ